MTPTETRLAMWRNGYAPLPLNGKNPDVNGKGWQEKRQQTNEREILLWDRLYPYAHNTGCLCRHVPALDVDILDRAACRAVYERLVERFEDAGVILCRIGRAPKFAVPFRTSTPFGKFATRLIPPGGGPAQLEFLCDGQQFVSDGIHPDTRQPYRWWPSGSDLTTVPRDALPPIDEPGARALVADLVALLVNECGFKRPEAAPERAVFIPCGNGTPRSPRAVLASVYGLIRTVLGGTPEQDRNSRLFWASCRVREMAAIGELPDDDAKDALDALHEAALRTGLKPLEINRTIASAMRPRA